MHFQLHKNKNYTYTVVNKMHAFLKKCTVN